MSIYSRLDRIAADVEKLNRQVKSVSNAPQSQRTSVEGGSIDFNDADGNLQAIFGGQDDGSTTVRHVDGPVPPIPSGLSAHVDGPIIQVTWDGTFEDAAGATFDWSHLEVVAVGPSSEQLRGTISDVTGASTSLAATVSGEWTVVARSVSRAGKHSLDGDAGTVEVELVDVAGAIEAVQDSANGKNKVTYSSHAPTPDDPGIFDDTWFVGQVGRPNDVVEATNYAPNPRAVVGGASWRSLTYSGATEASTFQTDLGKTVFRSALTNGSGYVYLAPAIGYSSDLDTLVPVSPGESLSGAMLVARSYSGTAQLRVGFRSASGAHVAWSSYGPAGSVSAAAFTRLTLEDMVVPDGAVYAFMHVSSTSGLGEWVEGTEAVLSKTLKVPDAFDGDTESGETVNESHYRWTGTPHASTSEKYLPALTIGDSDNWNIIEQYRHDGTGWVKVELSHYVFSSVDLGKATVGELDGIRIAGKTVRGEQLSGDAIDGKVITGGTYRTSDGTGEWSDAGLFISQSDGTSMVRFPTDGSPLSLTASDTQIERASVGELDMVNGAVRSGGTFSLAAGVTAPPSPPELTTGWQKVCTLEKPDSSLTYDWLGLAVWENANGKSWVRAVNVLGAEGDTRDVIECYDYDTGVFEQAFRLDINPRAGVTVIGDVAYVLGPDHQQSNKGKQWVHGFDLNTGERVTRWEFTRFDAPNQGKLAIGTDGTNLVVAGAHATVSRRLYVMAYNPGTGSQVGSDLVSDEWVAYTKDVQGVHRSGNTLWVSHVEAVREFTVSGSTITYTNSGWVNPNKNGAGFVVMPGNQPYIIDGSGGIYAGSQYGSGHSLDVFYTWYSGGLETTPSPVATVQAGARESIIVSTPMRAGMQKRIYYGPSGVGVWDRYAPTESTSRIISSNPPFWSITPPTTNTFPASTPAVLKSNIGGFQVRGDGSGSWGPLTFNADGTMTSAQIPSWIPVTSFLNSSAPATFGFAPAYRIWPDGKVEWRGVVATPDTTATTDFVTIPEAARPNSTVYLNGVGNSAQMVRIEFSTTISSQPFSGNIMRWLSLDSLYYYLT